MSHIIDRISDMEKRLRGQGFNAPPEYGSLKATMFEAAELLAEIQSMCRFTNQLEADLVECLQEAIQVVYGAYGPNTLLAKETVKDWQALLEKVCPPTQDDLAAESQAGNFDAFADADEPPEWRAEVSQV